MAHACVWISATLVLVAATFRFNDVGKKKAALGAALAMPGMHGGMHGSNVGMANSPPVENSCLLLHVAPRVRGQPYTDSARKMSVERALPIADVTLREALVSRHAPAASINGLANSLGASCLRWLFAAVMGVAAVAGCRWWRGQAVNIKDSATVMTPSSSSTQVEEVRWIFRFNELSTSVCVMSEATVTSSPARAHPTHPIFKAAIAAALLFVGQAVRPELDMESSNEIDLVHESVGKRSYKNDTNGPVKPDCSEKPRCGSTCVEFEFQVCCEDDRIAVQCRGNQLDYACYNRLEEHKGKKYCINDARGDIFCEGKIKNKWSCPQCCLNDETAEEKASPPSQGVSVMETNEEMDTTLNKKFFSDEKTISDEKTNDRCCSKEDYEKQKREHHERKERQAEESKKEAMKRWSPDDRHTP